MIVVIKARDLNHGLDRMRVAGLRVRKDANGRPLPIEYWCERTMTPILQCADGDVAFTVDIREEYVGKIPTNDSPNFTVVWREDTLQTLVGDGGNEYQAQYPWPQFEVDTYDENGAVNGTTMQGAGRIG